MAARGIVPDNIVDAQRVYNEGPQVVQEVAAIAGQVDQITVATLLVGTGFDAKLGPGVQGLGGLAVHCATTDLPAEHRVQVGRRAARPGETPKPGSAHFYGSPDTITPVGSDDLHPHDVVQYLHEQLTQQPAQGEHTPRSTRAATDHRRPTGVVSPTDTRRPIAEQPAHRTPPVAPPDKEAAPAPAAAAAARIGHAPPGVAPGARDTPADGPLPPVKGGDDTAPAGHIPRGVAPAEGTLRLFNSPAWGPALPAPRPAVEARGNPLTASPSGLDVPGSAEYAQENPSSSPVEMPARDASDARTGALHPAAQAARPAAGNALAGRQDSAAAGKQRLADLVTQRQDPSTRPDSARRDPSTGPHGRPGKLPRSGVARGGAEHLVPAAARVPNAPAAADDVGVIKAHHDESTSDPGDPQSHRGGRDGSDGYNTPEPDTTGGGTGGRSGDDGGGGLGPAGHGEGDESDDGRDGESHSQSAEPRTALDWALRRFREREGGTSRRARI